MLSLCIIYTKTPPTTLKKLDLGKLTPNKWTNLDACSFLYSYIHKCCNKFSYEASYFSCSYSVPKNALFLCWIRCLGILFKMTKPIYYYYYFPRIIYMKWAKIHGDNSYLGLPCFEKCSRTHKILDQTSFHKHSILWLWSDDPAR